MMKRLKIVVLLLICLCVLGAVSCTKDEMEVLNDDRLVGAWELETVICHVNASDEYLATILQQQIVAEQLLGYYVFQDTVQFDKQGFFMETGNILREEVFESLFDYLSRYELQDNKTFRVIPGPYSISSYRDRDRIATYEIDADLLMLQVGLKPEDWLWFKEYLFYHGHQNVQELVIEDVSYTQIYRKIKDFPYDREE